MDVDLDLENGRWFRTRVRAFGGDSFVAPYGVTVKV
jgi:hypothetical protein